MRMSQTSLSPAAFHDPRDVGGPAQPLLDVRNLQKHFPLRGGALQRVTGHVRAVDGVSFRVMKGETCLLYTSPSPRD